MLEDIDLLQLKDTYVVIFLIEVGQGLEGLESEVLIFEHLDYLLENEEYLVLCMDYLLTVLLESLFNLGNHLENEHFYGLQHLLGSRVLISD